MPSDNAKIQEYKCDLHVSFSWWREDGGEVKADHSADLQTAAWDHINAMKCDGYTSGQLQENLFDPRYGDINYHGSWGIKVIPPTMEDFGLLRPVIAYTLLTNPAEQMPEAAANARYHLVMIRSADYETLQAAAQDGAWYEAGKWLSRDEVLISKEVACAACSMFDDNYGGINFYVAAIQ